MYSDWDQISKEDHEVKYLLEKYEKRQTKENIAIMENLIDGFKAEMKAQGKTPYRKYFYEWIENQDDFKKLEKK